MISVIQAIALEGGATLNKTDLVNEVAEMTGAKKRKMWT